MLPCCVLLDLYLLCACAYSDTITLVPFQRTRANLKVYLLMPVTVRSSAKLAAAKKSCTSHKRLQNLNVEINKLASLVPLSTPLISCSTSSSSAVPCTSSGSIKPPTIPVLRLTSAFLKLQNFLKKTSYVSGSSGEHLSTNKLIGRMEKAIDGFLIILDKKADILYVSSNMSSSVGVLQQNVIGQNLVDITHPQFSSEIADSLKPSVLLPSTVEEECVISRYRQFCVRFISNGSFSKSPSHSNVQVCGILKVKLAPAKDCGNGVMEFVEPSAIGFIGECRVVSSVCSILEISIPYSLFIVHRSVDLKKVLSVERTVKKIIGHEPELLLDERFNVDDFLHPVDKNVMKNMRGYLMHTGHAVSPHFRFLTSSGDWVWMQLEATLRYKNGTSIPLFWEVKVRVFSQWGGRLKYNNIEQKELYSSECDQVPLPTNQSGVQSTPLVGSSDTSSPSSSLILMANQGFNYDHSFPNFTTPTVSCGSLVDTCPPCVNSALSTDLSLPCDFSPQMGTLLQSAMSTDSTPSTGSVPFQDSQTLDYLLQPAQNNFFNSQIPSGFNFSCNTSSSHHPPNPLPSSVLDCSMPEVQNVINGSNSASSNHTKHPFIQQFLDETLANSNFSSLTSNSLGGSTTFESIYYHSHHQPNSVQNSIST